MDESKPPADLKSNPPAQTPADFYDQACQYARLLYTGLRAPIPGETFTVPLDILEGMIGCLKAGDQEMLILAEGSPETGLANHAVNTAVFSLRVGVTLGLPREELISLGVGAYLHDIGMAAHEGLAAKPGVLTAEERHRLHSHAEGGQKLLKHFRDLNEGLRNDVYHIIGQCHERMEGSGYPLGLGRGSIHQLARIVGLCDMYESVTHARPWRKRVLPHNALRRLLEVHDDEFDPEMVDTLVKSLSFYPPGSCVLLNTGEVGRVVRVTPELPTRPALRILLDNARRPLRDERRVDLMVSPALHIEGAVELSAP